MKRDPFGIKQIGSDIKDKLLDNGSGEIDGDIIVAPQYQKHPRHHLDKFRRSRLLFYLCFLAFTALAAKLYYVQILQGEKYRQTADKNRIRTLPMPAARGLIFDRSGARLAYNVPDFTLFLVPADLPKAQADEDAEFGKLGKLLNREAFDLVEPFAHVSRESFQSLELASGLSQEQAIRFTKEANQYPGITIQATEQRTYAATSSLAHALGYLGKISEAGAAAAREAGYDLTDRVGKAGIEKFYEQGLRGRSGAKLMEVDSLGREKRLIETKTPVAGNNLYLNLDLGLQTVADEALAAAIKKIKSPGGAVIAINPENGAILAFAVLPGYNNSRLSQGISAADFQTLAADAAKPLFNRAVSGEYPPGSTFKIIVGAGALAEGIINEDFSVLSVGGFNIGKYHFPDWKAGGHGRTDIIKALAESVNTFFYVAGGGYESAPGGFTGLGLERMRIYGQRFGLGQPTGIDLPGEASGWLPSAGWKQKKTGERWFLGDTYHLAIGQGDVLATPLQVANFTAAIANGGALYKPRLAHHFVLPDGRPRLVPPETINPEVVPPRVTKIIRAGLRAAVTEGSARSLSTLPIPLAGKTGTAEYGEKGKPHAWFTGFGPYDNPEIVVTVLVEQGKGGNISATPVAKKIFEYYFKNAKTQNPNVK